jgi:predicted transcriptional regulator
MSEVGSIEHVDIGLLDTKEAQFYFADGGFLGLKYKETDYPHVTLKRALPVGRPSEYISVYDVENKEIGIIREIAELTDKNLQVVAKELDSRYFCPYVLEVKSVKDKLGYVYAEFMLGADKAHAHTKSCALKDVSRNIRMLNDKSILIFDVDGNRYLIPDIYKLDKQSRKRLEPYLF